VLARGTTVWARRGILAAVLIGAAIVPGRAASVTSRGCGGRHCARTAGTIRWTRVLPGSWVAQDGAVGTVPASGQAYAAAGSGVAAVGFGQTVAAYRLSDGRALWTASLANLDLPPGAAVVSVRAWTGVLTAGVSVPDAAGGRYREEVVLSAATGQLIRAYPAAVYGGAVWADPARTVIVGTTAVTSYVNATGRVAWRVPTGSAAQAWRVSGDDLFVTVSAGGYLSTSPVTALRRIDLLTGAQATLRASGRPFAGTLTAAADGTVLFADQAGLLAYSGTDGRLLWRRDGAVAVGIDAIRQVLYVSGGNLLVGLDPDTGKVVTSATTLGAAGLYSVSNGVALGLDEGALGDAWGYSLAARRVIWTARAVPWPHFFVDLSGIGGSADQASGVAVLAACARLGQAPGSGGPRPCARPELVAVGP
jgi:PQQ-like domain